MASAPEANVSAPLLWMDRARVVVAALLVWLLLHVVGNWLVPAGLDRPVALTSAPWGPLAGILFAALLWACAAVAAALGGGSGLRRPMILLGLALCAWAFERGRSGGTMEDWLILCNPTPGPPRSGPYALLLLDYLYLTLGLAGAYAVMAVLRIRGARQRRQVFGLEMARAQRTAGLQALGITVVVSGVVAFVLMGSETTLRGQVYFAFGAGFALAVMLARRVARTVDPLWYAPAPLILGIVGLLVAAFRPALAVPSHLSHLAIVPAWPLARALPIEVVAIGLVGTFWMLRPLETGERA